MQTSLEIIWASLDQARVLMSLVDSEEHLADLQILESGTISALDIALGFAAARPSRSR